MPTKTNSIDSHCRFIAEASALIYIVFDDDYGIDLSVIYTGFGITLVFCALVARGSKEHSRVWLIAGSLASGFTAIYMFKLQLSAGGVQIGPIFSYQVGWKDFVWSPVLFGLTTTQVCLIKNSHRNIMGQPARTIRTE